ncbi:thioredoxin family protein [Catalinimonas niigatensis]|uniref:thioredoxin family protein n=1 Tax=Catalinimonas niigatensis TaxID=1397264 RepID=UPI0026669229|nr:thioredoxin family protein [Catalinimonas niigatensis]WPP51234.1 thioredoxin family protein [Catalinimonas niigatensis]
MKWSIIILSILTLGIGISANTARQQGYQVGDYATDFNLEGVDGKTVSLSDYREAEGYIVIFTCNTCPYAKMYEQRIIDLHKTYADKGFPVVAINPNCPERSPGDAMSEMKKRAEDKGFGFAYLQDVTQETTKAYGATNTPQVFLLDKESSGKLKVAYIGTIDNNYKDAAKANVHYVQAAVDALIEGKKVPETKTKAIGCTIKWKQA